MSPLGWPGCKSPIAELIGATLFVVALAARMLLGADYSPFITFFPAVFISTLLAGTSAGALCAVSGALAAWYLFLPPEYSFLLYDSASVASLLLFASSCAAFLYLSRQRDLAVQRLTKERDMAAVLFQELQHRVANNMMFISSVLQLQRRTLPKNEAVARRSLGEAAERVASFGQLHRKLYEPSAISQPCKKVLSELCHEILNGSGVKNIVCTIDGCDDKLDLPRLIAVALIINEALTNALKYAFEDGARGTIQITFSKNDQLYSLCVADDGKGFELDKVSDGIGRKVMDALVTQLDGSLNVKSSGHGTTVSVSFPA